jgi:hypothetical protein
MPWSRTSNPPIVLNANKQQSGLVTHPVGQADDGLDELTVVQGLALLAFELDVKRLTDGN